MTGTSQRRGGSWKKADHTNSGVMVDDLEEERKAKLTFCRTRKVAQLGVAVEQKPMSPTHMGSRGGGLKARLSSVEEERDATTHHAQARSEHGSPGGPLRWQ